MIPKLDESAVASWRDKRIFVLGDVMLDRFVYGSVERISPEAPIPVVHFQSEKFMLGGAANVARNIVALGGRPILAGVLGRDEAGDRIAGPLVEWDQIDSFFVRVENLPTTVKTRFVSGGQQIMRLDIERKFDLTEPYISQICDHFAQRAGEIAAVVLSDYAKGVLSPPLIRQIIDVARQRAIPVVVDPKTTDIGRYRGASILTPNASEASRITNLDCSTDASAGTSAELICNLAAVDAVVLTRGAQGMTIYDSAGDISEPLHIPTAASEVFDVSGAGDTVVAALSLAKSAGLDVAISAHIANLAAGIVVGKRGTAVVRAPELTHALKRAAGDREPKIVTTEEAGVVVSEWKERGLRVGFTNGCFDLLHPGHVELLKRSRAACDRLVVALNSDASVRRLKGESRPVQNEAARLMVMASLDSVDLVTIFNEDTPIRTIEFLRPDLLIKGADYSIETVVGADFVQSYGGKIMLVPLKIGHSTTSMISRARAEEAVK